MRKKTRLVITEEAVREALEGFASLGLVTKFQLASRDVRSFAEQLENAAGPVASARHGRRFHWAPQQKRKMPRIPVKLPSGEPATLSTEGHDPLIKLVIEELCSRFVPGGVIVYIGDAEDKFLHLEIEYLKRLGVVVPAPAKMPDVVIHDTRRNWLLLVEAVMSAGPVDAKRRMELKELFRGCKAGLVFVTAFATRADMRSFLTQISWETEVWVAENPDHMIHFNGERFLGPYPDALPKAK